jgi:hypothetical protein
MLLKLVLFGVFVAGITVFALGFSKLAAYTRESILSQDPSEDLKSEAIAMIITGSLLAFPSAIVGIVMWLIKNDQTTPVVAPLPKETV